MAKLALNKSSLSHEKGNLQTFARFLPSLDLKRRQLIAERTKAMRVLSQAAHSIRAHTDAVGRNIPMLANQHIFLQGLVSLEGLDIGEENILGVRLPLLKKVRIRAIQYGFLLQPHWVDRYVEVMQEVIELRAHEYVARQRFEVLELAVRKVTQRVNLFDKVLIPKAQDNIRRIRIYLSDSERAAVVRSKIAKAKHEATRRRNEGAP